MSVTIHTGDCRDVLRSLAPESVHCVVTSPPYWKLRDYGVAGQIGLEISPDAFIAELVAVFRALRRVLRADGTCWVNLGDSYVAGGSGGYSDTKGRQLAALSLARKPTGDLKHKDLCGIPWRVAFALQQPYYIGKIKNEADRVWLAAMIDAEGCMFIHKRKEGNKHNTYTKKDGTVSEYMRSGDHYGAGLEIANTNESVIHRCLQITEQGSHFKHEKDRRQPLWRWNMRSNECRAIIQEIYPYLIAKKHQARLLLGCPGHGPKAEAAHQGLIDLHNGKTIDFDFPPPASMYEPGFYLRQDIIWSKLNPMPESVRDRCTKAHEYIFLLSKSERYYFDQDAIAEAAAYSGLANQDATGRFNGKHQDGYNLSGRAKDLSDRARPPNSRPHSLGQFEAENDRAYAVRNKRSVWEVATAPFPEAHFATFPPALIEPCILAGCPKGGTVLDCFGGAGTTGLVADRLGRDAILIELNPQYAAMAEQRIRNDAGMFAQVAAE